MKNSAKLIAHYTSFRVACEHLLPERRIRFSPLANMNDPRENRERMVGVGWSGDDTPALDERTAASDKLKTAYRDYSKVFCGTLDGENPNNLNTKRCFGRPRMWAQYADNHRGICLLFNRDKLDLEIQAAVQGDACLYSGEVVYDDYLKHVSAAACDLDFDQVREVGQEAALRKQVDTYHRALFLRKDSDWIGESEYRWVIHRWERGHEFVPFDESLESIVMGVDCPEVYIPTIMEQAHGRPVFRLEWDSEMEDFYTRELAAP